VKILIVGGAGGIGSAVAKRLASRGNQLILFGRTEQTLAAVASETGASALTVDARDPEALERAAAAFAPIDGIVNCAGSILLKPAHLTSAAEWRDTIETNLTTAYAAVRAGVKSMSGGGGSIVLCSSAAARTGLANHEAIAAAKAGVIGLTLSAAATYGPRNIRVNCVAPGLVDTPLASRITGNEAALKLSQEMHALGRIGKADDVASAIVWLLDPENAWITGQVIGVDGGLGTVRGSAARAGTVRGGATATSTAGGMG
jgi:NAD(P)-dependent dehydrogenase (short-subunit alcohol dehydrogenase family)